MDYGSCYYFWLADRVFYSRLVYRIEICINFFMYCLDYKRTATIRKGWWLAAIGGLADQSAMGAQTGGILTKVTYLVGAVFIIATLFLTKMTLTSMHGVDNIRTEMSTSLEHDHASHEGAVDEHAGHNHAPGEHVDHAQTVTENAVGTAKSVGMKAVSDVKETIETKVESITEEKKND